MAMLMRLCGIILAAVGLALAVMSIASPSQMQVYGLTPETGAILLVGGILSLGLSSLIERDVPSRADYATPDLTTMRPMRGAADLIRPAATAGAVVLAGAEAAKPVSAETISETLSGAKSTVSETIEALEQAKSDIKAALGGAESFDLHDQQTEVAVPDVPPPPPVRIEAKADTPEPEPVVSVPEPIVPAEIEVPPAVEDEPEEADVEVTGEPGLFVVEEQTVRGRPARLLSDGTVEAETDEGWMRFENLEHLNEYLDMVAQA